MSEVVHLEWHNVQGDDFGLRGQEFDPHTELVILKHPIQNYRRSLEEMFSLYYVVSDMINRFNIFKLLQWTEFLLKLNRMNMFLD